MQKTHLALNLLRIGLFGLAIVVVSDLASGATFTPLGLADSYALDVSTDGTVVGFTGNSVFRWTPNGTILLDALERDGVAISSDASTIVGSIRPPTGGIEAFRWTTTSGYELLGDFPGAPSPPGSSAFDTNRNGTVVVGAGRLDDRTPGFRWTSATGLQDLGDGTPLAISPNGEYVVGHFAGGGAIAGPATGK
jgi:uncharacterized membrane protein